MSRSVVAGRPWASLPTYLRPPAPSMRPSRTVGELRRRRWSRAAERGAHDRLVETVLAQEVGAPSLLAEDRVQQARVDARMAEVADRQLAVAQPHGDRAALAQRALEVEALGRVDQVAQGLVA